MNIASIDIGSNTVLLLIAEVNAKNKKITSVINQIRFPRISSNLVPGGTILQDKIDQLISVIDEYKIEIEQNDVKIVLPVATNALRIANNSEDIIRKIFEKFGFETKIISGEREAFLSYLGATSLMDSDKKKLVIDIGGGSTELVLGDKNSILFKQSFPIGVVSLNQKFGSYPPSKIEILEIEKHIYSFLEDLKLEYDSDTIGIAVAGTPTTLSSINQNLTEFREDLIDNSFLSLENINSIIGSLSVMTIKEISHQFGNVVAGREDILLNGSIILKVIMEKLKLPRIIVSTKGLRYGVIIDYLQSNNWRI